MFVEQPLALPGSAKYLGVQAMVTKIKLLFHHYQCRTTHLVGVSVDLSLEKFIISEIMGLLFSSEKMLKYA